MAENLQNKDLNEFAMQKVASEIRAGSKSDRRQFFRVPVILPISMRVQTGRGALSDEEQTMATDISTGGLSFICDRPLALNSVINIVISGLPFMKNPKIVASVARCQRETTRRGKVVYVIGADFRSSVSRELRAQLMRAVTILQRVNEHREVQCC